VAGKENLHRRNCAGEGKHAGEGERAGEENRWREKKASAISVHGGGGAIDPALMKLDTGRFSPTRFQSCLHASCLASTPFRDEEIVSPFFLISLHFIYFSAMSAKR
jgi:hypothetical protein